MISRGRQAIVCLFSAALLAAFAFGTINSADADDTTKPNLPANRVLIFGIDGLRPDALKAAQTPNLDALAAEGAFADDTQILGERFQGNDTISGPGWSSILSGVWADKHKVNDNNPTTNDFAAYPILFERIKKVYPDALTVSLVTWRALHEAIVRGADISRNLKPKGSADYATADRKCAAAAAHILAERNPLAMLVYFGNVDNTGHAKGFHPASKPYLKATEQVDGYIGQVLEALRARETYAQENWLILVTTDHGGKGTDHQRGQNVPEIRTVFLIVSGPATTPGKIDQPTFITDVVPTALAHLGIAADEGWGLDGQVVGLKTGPAQEIIAP